MPRRCTFGCEPNDAPIHCFPNYTKFPDRFKKWVQLCGGKLEKGADYVYFSKRKVCDKHFTDADRNRNKRLNALAVPSLYLTGITECNSYVNVHKATENRASTSQSSKNDMESNDEERSELRTLIRTETQSIDDSGRGSEMRNSSRKTTVTSGSDDLPDVTPLLVFREHSYTVASKDRLLNLKKGHARAPVLNCVQLTHMRREIKQLRSEVSRLRKNGSFQSRFKNASKLLESTALKKITQRMTKPSQLFINMQIQSSKSPKGRRFSIEEKVLCLSLYKKSPRCYALLHSYFTLPSSKAMKRLLSNIKLCSGINPIIFEKIKKTVSEKPIKDKLCSLAFDEMSITPQINYNCQKDIIEGFASNDENKFADHVLVFMVKGIKQNFKQPIAYYFTSCLNKTELKKLIKTVISHAQKSGLIILNTVCDQSTVNVSAINELIKETKAMHLRKEIELRYDCFCVNNKKIVPLFDIPHLIKGIRNNLMTKDLLYTTKNVEKRVKWEYLQNIYNADKSYGELRLLHKLTEEHMNPEKINKMRVKTATQVFSHSVAVVTEHLTGRGDLPEECRQVVDIILLINNLFDSLNVSSLKIPNGKVFKGPIKAHSPHHQLWTESKIILKSVKFVQNKITANKVRLVETVVPSIKNLIKTIEGMEAIWQIVSKQYGFDALLTRNFNQDPVENFFGNIRSYGARNNAPNTVSFEGAFKALLLNNYSSPHSRRANCEEDNNDCLQNLDFFLRENYETEKSTDVPKEVNNNIQFNEYLFEENLTQDAGQKNYVCGWVLTKCLKYVCKSCQQCRKTILEQDDKNENNAYTKAKEYKNKNWLCYPSREAENCFHKIQNITQSFLKKNIPKKDSRKTIIEFCNIFIDFPFSCVTHKDALKKVFLEQTINLLLYSWCKNVNRILSGKIVYEGDEEIKKNASQYYNKHKHYKNKK